MALFRRPAQRGADDVGAFWEWWTATGRGLAETRFEGESGGFDRELTARVETLGPLTWEIVPGETSGQVLLLRPTDDPEAPALARRAVLAAPEADPLWSYADAAPPAADPESVVLTGDDIPFVDLSRLDVGARLADGRFDLHVHHPVFAGLSAEERDRIAALALRSGLGDLDAGLWVGEVTASEVPPLDGFGLVALRSVVQDLKRQHLDADGRPRWMMLRGETPQGPLAALVRGLLQPATAPHLDTYVAITLPYAGRGADGLPDESSEQSLAAFQEALERVVGTSGEVVAHLSTGGRRTLHAYVDSTAGLQPELKRLVKSWPEGRAGVHEMTDPGWDAVAHLRG